MSPAPLLRNPTLDPLDQPLSKLTSLIHLQKQYHTLIAILRPPLAHNDTICDLWEVGFKHAVHVCGAETHAGGV